MRSNVQSGMPSCCQCLAPDPGKPLCSEEIPSPSHQLLSCLSGPSNGGADPLGHDGYVLLDPLSPEERRMVLHRLPDQEYAERIREFDRVVRLQAEIFRDQYASGNYRTNEITPSETGKQSFNRRMARRFKRFVHQDIPRHFYEFRELPLQYGAIDRAAYAIYKYSTGVIHVGNIFMEDVIRRRLGDIRCTLGHEREHLRSHKSHREMTEPLFAEALILANNLTFPHDPDKPFAAFRSAMIQEWWYNANNYYINSEGEILARLYETACYKTERRRYRKESPEEAADYMRHHIQAILHERHPLVAALILKNIERIVAHDIPAAQMAFSAYLFTSGQNWAELALQTYNSETQACVTTPSQQCADTSAATPALARPASE